MTEIALQGRERSLYPRFLACGGRRSPGKARSISLLSHRCLERLWRPTVADRPECDPSDEPESAAAQFFLFLRGGFRLASPVDQPADHCILGQFLGRVAEYIRPAVFRWFRHSATPHPAYAVAPLHGGPIVASRILALRTRSKMPWCGDGGVHLNREILKRPAVITPFPGRQQPSILGTGAVELPDLSGKSFADLLGTGLVVAVEDHQTDACPRQKKLLEVFNDVLEIAPFALSDQGRVN